MRFPVIACALFTLATSAPDTAYGQATAVPQSVASPATIEESRTPRECLAVTEHKKQAAMQMLQALWPTLTNVAGFKDSLGKRFYQTTIVSGMGYASQCVGKFSGQSVPKADLEALATLYFTAGQGQQAQSLLDRLFALSTPSERASLLQTRITRFMSSSVRTAREMAPYEAYATQLDAMGETAVTQQLAAHVSLLLTWQRVLKKKMLSEDDPHLWAHIEKIHTLARAELVKPATPADRRYVTLGTLDWITDIMAKHLAEQGDVIGAKTLLMQEMTFVAKTGQGDTPTVRQTLLLYDMIGHPAPAVSTPLWYNTSAGQTTLPLTGKVTILHFTADPGSIGGFQPDTSAYRVLRGLTQQIDSTKMQIVLVVPVFKRSAGQEQEIPLDSAWKRNRTYWNDLHVTCPIASDENMASLFKSYHVSGIPYWFVVDKKGIIRAFVFGVRSDMDTWLSGVVQPLVAE